MTRSAFARLVRLDEFRWELPAAGAMLGPGRIFASEALLAPLAEDGTIDQIAAGATLQGLVGAALAMPDAHLGYGLCIGGVVATDAEHGAISPGAVGYDINCGVRLLRSNLTRDDVMPRRDRLADRLFARVPCGMGGSGPVRIARREWADVLRGGASWVVRRGQGWESDLERCESGGALRDADPEMVSDTAKERGQDQIGTLGSGNHFLEVQEVERVHDAAVAAVFGLEVGQITVMVHCGSRGLGHQVCTDYLKTLRGFARRGREAAGAGELVSAPLRSREGQRYWRAMNAAANFAWANRQWITDSVRTAFAEVFERPAERLGLHLVYDVSHNLAKLETHEVDGHVRSVCVHRKGATRAFPAGHPEVPPAYRSAGQPVLIPGDMGRASWVLAGAPGAMRESFGSCCHGAGRLLSRAAAVRAMSRRDVRQELLDAGVLARARGRRTLEEEAPEAYKDVDEVVRVVEGAGLATRVARLKPIAVVKG
jgi:tRNA-splicing ligase RtcB